MLVQCLVEGGKIPFLMHGRDLRKAKKNVNIFLEDLSIPRKEVHIKKFTRPRQTTQQRTKAAR